MKKFDLKYKYVLGSLQITFRVWRDGVADVKLDDNLALSMGYFDARTFRKKHRAFEDAIDLDWLRIVGGKIFIYGKDDFIPIDGVLVLGGKF